MNLPTADDVLAAQARISGHIVRTPVLRHPWLDEAAGRPVLVKAEPLQRTGSFKLRGATNAVLRLAPERRRAGLVAYSSGNHAQAVACAGAAVGAPVTIVMPSDAPAIKVANTRRWGAEIILYDRMRDDREAIGREIAGRTGASLIPPYDHPDVMAGQGTLALELYEDAAADGVAIGALLVCAGGGGMVAGCALATLAVSPNTRVFAVEPAGSDDTARSLRAGERLANAPGASMLCDALLASMPGELTFAVNREHLAGGIVVTDDEVRAAMRWSFANLKLVAEPGGSVALAAVLAGKAPETGGALGVVVSGGNVDPATFAEALAGG